MNTALHPRHDQDHTEPRSMPNTGLLAPFNGALAMLWGRVEIVESLGVAILLVLLLSLVWQYLVTLA